ncbi:MULTISPECIES: membrane protein insertase YidC [unclassified Pseudoalteromonas]|uniref:membrane protein insertase YidC n=1 Tax=unclassified Pseudoalteromonas TaxID=194690 RepID=UPI000CF73D1D|nr:MULTISPECIES: membrane protein insertase YidC [unclassified Pseudoalteromonas]MBS3797003.1 membrane protein insertase YidC [Pseudoalteromonas sp. BDTF-M6]
MESQRTFLFIGLLLVSFLLFQEWNNDYNQPANNPSAQTQSNAPANAGQSDVPNSDIAEPLASTSASQQIITVTTDVFAVKIDTLGGDIIEAKLLQHAETHGSDEPYLLLGQFEGNEYFAQSGLIGLNGPDARKEGRPVYQSEQQSYTMTGDTLAVPLTFVDAQGVSYTKTYTFHKSRYDVTLDYDIQNNTANAVQVQLYTQVKRTVQDKGSLIDQSYLGGAYGTDEVNYEKYSFDDIQDKELKESTQGGYVAFLQHYFVSAWVPAQDQTNTVYMRLPTAKVAQIGIKSEPVNIAPASSATFASTYYMGPKDTDALEALHPNLDLAVDYGWLWFISQPLLTLLKFLYSFLGNWGLAIIAITIVVKSLLYPLTKAQYTSMAKMRALQPKMQALKERYGDDRQKFGQAMMEMYRKEKVNPMGGCFPLLLQMPIFLALFYVFLESPELRHAEFGLWLTDLSSKDPFYVLPVLFGASMFLMQKLQPMTVTDPMQQKMMTWMPVFFSVFFLWFPSGLVLYWLVSNLISIAQMLIIYRGMEKKGLKVRG